QFLNDAVSSDPFRQFPGKSEELLRCRLFQEIPASGRRTEEPLDFAADGGGRVFFVQPGLEIPARLRFELEHEFFDLFPLVTRKLRIGAGSQLVHTPYILTAGTDDKQHPARSEEFQNKNSGTFVRRFALLGV